MKVTVSGIYRHKFMEHTEYGTKQYEVSFDAPVGMTHGQVIGIAGELIKKDDLDFRSIKTHHIKWGEPEVPPATDGPVEDPLAPPEFPPADAGKLEEIFD